MWAPRRRAASSSSRTTTPEPSPITKPSRSLSKGRDAVSGWSLRVDRARMAAKPPTPGVPGDDGGNPADAAADVDAHHLAVVGADLEPGVGQGEVGGRHRELDEAVHLLDVFLLDPAQGVEALHLAGEARRMLRGVE